MSITIGMAINTHKQKLVEALNHLKSVDTACSIIYDSLKEYIDYYLLKINPLKEIPLCFDLSAKRLTLWGTVLEFYFAYTLDETYFTSRLSLRYSIRSVDDEKFSETFAQYYEEDGIWKINSSKEKKPLTLKEGIETQICLVLSQFIEEAVSYHTNSYLP